MRDPVGGRLPPGLGGQGPRATATPAPAHLDPEEGGVQPRPPPPSEEAEAPRGDNCHRAAGVDGGEGRGDPRSPEPGEEEGQALGSAAGRGESTHTHTHTGAGGRSRLTREGRSGWGPGSQGGVALEVGPLREGVTQQTWGGVAADGAHVGLKGQWTDPEKSEGKKC